MNTTILELPKSTEKLPVPMVCAKPASFEELAGRAVRVDVGRTERVDEALGSTLARRARILDDCQGFGAVLG